jgi:hypothetical protein
MRKLWLNTDDCAATFDLVDKFEIESSAEIAPGVIVHYDVDNNVVQIEMIAIENFEVVRNYVQNRTTETNT